jgi:hypothetical protein
MTGKVSDLWAFVVFWQPPSFYPTAPPTVIS